MTYLFVSPHLDDVVLSCGGLVSRLAAAGERLIVATVMTGDLPPGRGVPWVARRNHRAWRLGERPFAARRVEDEAAMRVLGASYRHLGLLDAIYRIDESGRPYYRTASAGVPVSPKDLEETGAAVRKKLEELREATLSGRVQLYCPLGAGGHVDHVIVRSVVQSMFRPEEIAYYEDHPYATRLGAVRASMGPPDAVEWSSIVHRLTPAEIETRIAAVGCYPSQLPGLFPSRLDRYLELIRARLPVVPGFMHPAPDRFEARERMASALRSYIEAVGGERYWFRQRIGGSVSLTPEGIAS